MSSATSHRAGRSTTRVLNPPRRKGTVLERPEILYTAEAAATGGRAGHAATSDGRVDVELDVPKEMGGSGGPGTNPEQLFAVGYAACFQSALLRFANGRGLDLSESRVTARVGIGLLRSGGLGLAVALDLDAPGLSRDVAVRPDEPGARDVPLLTRDTRQHRGHAYSRRLRHRASGCVSCR